MSERQGTIGRSFLSLLVPKQSILLMFIDIAWLEYHFLNHRFFMILLDSKGKTYTEAAMLLIFVSSMTKKELPYPQS